MAERMPRQILGKWGWLRWLAVYIGSYLGGPFLAGTLYGILDMIFPALSKAEAAELFYFAGAMLLQAGLVFLLVKLLILDPQNAGWETVGFQRPRKGAVLFYGIGGGLVMFAGILALSSLVAFFQPTIEPQYFQTLVEDSSNGVQIFLLLLSGSILAPMMEEVLFRGLLYTGLKERIGVWPAILVAGMIFGAVHLDIWRFLPLAFGGAALCWTYQKTGNIWINMIAHGLWNGIMTFLSL